MAPEVFIFAAVAFLAAAVSSIAGAGVGVLLLPVLVFFLGIQVAVPVLTLVLIVASASRAAANWREIDLPVAAWLSAGSLPMTVLGTTLFTISDPHLLTRLLGAFLIGSVLWRFFNPRPPKKRSAVWFLPVGAVFGFLVGLISGVGPFLAPFFLAHGLRKAAYIGTAALCILAVQITKTAVFGQTDFLTPRVLRIAAVLIPFIILGILAGKRIMAGLPERIFEWVITGVLLVAGLAFLVRG